MAHDGFPYADDVPGNFAYTGPKPAPAKPTDPRGAEIARLSRDYDELRETHDRKAAEIARLRAENEALREALKDAASRAHAVLARLSPPR